MRTGIRLKNNKYVATYWYNNKHLHIGTYLTIEDAIEKRNEKIKELIVKIPEIIITNENNNYIIIATNNEVIVDKELYYDLIKYKW